MKCRELKLNLCWYCRVKGIRPDVPTNANFCDTTIYVNALNQNISEELRTKFNISLSQSAYDLINNANRSGKIEYLCAAMKLVNNDLTETIKKLLVLM